MKLAKRTYRHSQEFRKQHPAANAFLRPQREHPATVQHPKPAPPVKAAA